MEDLMFEIIDENGVKQKYELLHSFKEKEKNYAIYTDNTYDEENNLNIYASTFEIVDETIQLFDIETEEEYEMIDEKIKEGFGDK